MKLLYLDTMDLAGLGERGDAKWGTALDDVARALRDNDGMLALSWHHFHESIGVGVERARAHFMRLLDAGLAPHLFVEHPAVIELRYFKAIVDDPDHGVPPSLRLGFEPLTAAVLDPWLADAATARPAHTLPCCDTVQRRNRSLMGFQHGDGTDKCLVVAAAHEYLRAQGAFKVFSYLAGENHEGRQDKRHLLHMYDAYARFVGHVYEFYIACISRDRRDARQIPSDERDRIIQHEVIKLRRNRADRIRRGDAPRWMGPARQYEGPIPPSFAEHFRQARNRSNHADHRRASRESGVSLAEFFEKYHSYLMLLFEEAHWLWNVEDLESQEWADIVAFNLAVDDTRPEYRSSLYRRFLMAVEYEFDDLQRDSAARPLTALPRFVQRVVTRLARWRPLPP